MTATTRLAVVGAGRAGMVHALNTAHWVVPAGLVCVVDADETVGERAAAELGVPASTAWIRRSAERASMPSWSHARRLPTPSSL